MGCWWPRPIELLSLLLFLDCLPTWLPLNLLVGHPVAPDAGRRQSQAATKNRLLVGAWLWRLPASGACGCLHAMVPIDMHYKSIQESD